MRLEVHVESATREIRSLYGWLRSDPDVRTTFTADPQTNAAPRPGEMGTTLDVLALVTGNGWSAASFVLALATWRRTRPQRPQVEIRRGDTVIVLTDCSPEQIQHATRMLEAAVGEDTGT
ncbi:MULTISPECIES: effector-associated constant component EACC1 [Streptomyces]|uniref:Uncharacterized protein n=2 Tax=Streptomyces TaxID=1883 RepID=A0A101PPH0_STRCK|nr:hypothetical protein [Streptomyces corchorusii]KUN15078.1 hypothetical protein AQJ11_43710 [Streptomyces corchorusii]